MALPHAGLARARIHRRPGRSHPASDVHRRRCHASSAAARPAGR